MTLSPVTGKNEQNVSLEKDERRKKEADLIFLELLIFQDKILTSNK